jgi:bifunctional UDP-N-acetylglucosamine pyrophosphorylase / glucosamine-1-phosphate N-acetyltransferase
MLHLSELSVIILAAGKGTRMKSDKAKVLHEVFFAPMVQHVVDAVLPLAPQHTVVVIGHQRQAVQAALAHIPCLFAVQEEQLGTGHAVLAAEPALDGSAGTVMILCGDTPLIESSTLAEMFAQHRQNQATLTLMTTSLADPTNYGRILRSPEGMVEGIIEQKDASPEQLTIKEINAGIYCVDKEFLFSSLRRVGRNNSQNEVYLTDIVALAVECSVPIERFPVRQSSEVLGVNSRVELAEAHRQLQLRRNRHLMLDGVTMFNAETVTVGPEVTIKKDVILENFVHISGKSTINSHATICQGTILVSCFVGEGVVIGPYCCLHNAEIPAGTTLAPHSKFN